MKMPRDNNHNAIPLVQNSRALAVTVDTTISAATDITLNTSTTLIEVNALSQGVYMRYQATASSTNFDEFIQAGAVRHYIKPYGVTVISFIEAAASASIVVIEK